MSNKLKQRLRIKEGKLWRHKEKHKRGMTRCPTCVRMENVIGTLKDAIQEYDKGIKKAREEVLEIIDQFHVELDNAPKVDLETMCIPDLLDYIFKGIFEKLKSSSVKEEGKNDD